MFAQHTVSAIVALASIDEGVTAKERDRLSAVLSGRTRETVSDLDEDSPFVKYAEAAKILNVSLPTVKRYAKQGVLVRVRGTGRSAIGLTPESVKEFKERQKMETSI